MSTCNVDDCPERHCQVCGRGHVTADGRGTDQTCVRCLGQARANLDKIHKLATHALGIAIMRGINSTAAVLAGPVADIEAWWNMRMAAVHRPGQRINAAWLEQQVDVPHPEWVLGNWERQVRLHLDQMLSPGTSQPTLTEARDYLDHQLTWLAHDPTFAFDEMARDLAACRAYLENVMHDGEAVDRGAECYMCGGARLVKDYGKTEDDDRWKCPRCRQWWSDHDYRIKVTGIYLNVADELPLPLMAKRVRVPDSTLRRWAYGERRRRKDGTVHERPPKIQPSGHDHAGHRLYRVDEVLAVRDQLATREVG